MDLYWIPLGAGGHCVPFCGRMFEAVEVRASTGAVGSRHLGRWRLFRYELRCWRGGSIPDLGYAVGGAQRLSTDHDVAQRILGLVATSPAPVWGRDELNAGEMWDCNSVIAWLIATAGIATDAVLLPPGGRAPGWHAGLVVSRRRRPTAAADRWLVAHDLHEPRWTPTS